MNRPSRLATVSWANHAAISGALSEGAGGQMKCPIGSRPMKKSNVISGPHQAHTTWLRYVTATAPYAHWPDGRPQRAADAPRPRDRFRQNPFAVRRRVS